MAFQACMQKKKKNQLLFSMHMCVLKMGVNPPPPSPDYTGMSSICLQTCLTLRRSNMGLDSSLDLPPVYVLFMYMYMYITLSLHVACRNITPSLSFPPPPVSLHFSILHPLLSSTHPHPLHSLFHPSSNSLPGKNPGGLSHRWVWPELTCAWQCLQCSALSFQPLICLHTFALSGLQNFKHVSLWTTLDMTEV